MRNLKKFLALVLAMMMALSLMVTANAQNAAGRDYPDIADAEFTDAIDVLTGMGVFRGDNGNFKPTETISRAEAAAVLYRLVTGDVDDKQDQLYAPQATRFADVTADDWFAGYVGYAVDAGLAKGYDGKFDPYRKVTGYEMLAMLLRAVGYGKNGEFTGDAWRINVGARAQSLDILDTIESSHYANTLSQGSAREVVAELTFQTATKVPTVTWTMLGGYNDHSQLLGGEPNPTLGEREFGLTSNVGIVVGNQATGESKTKIGFETNASDAAEDAGEINGNGSYKYADNAAEAGTAGNVTKSFGIKTGLGLFGHKVTVWYKAGTEKAYAVIDEASHSAMVYAEDANLSGEDANKLGDAADKAGFTVKNNSKAYTSDRYNRFSDETAAKFDAESPVKMYALISNNGDKTVDVVIALSAEVAKIYTKDTTAKDKTLTLGSGGEVASSFGKDEDGKILLDQLTPDSVDTLGTLVTAWEVVGTTDDANPDEGDADREAFLYQLDELKDKVTSTVSTYKLGTDGDATKVIEVTLGSDTLKRSGITEGGKIIDDCLEELLNSNTKAGISYTFYKDVLGRFIAVETPNDDSFVYTTYADFEVGALGSGKLSYYITGVDWDGKIVENHVLTKLGEETMDGTLYATLPFTRKDLGTSVGNSILPGINAGVMINEAGKVSDEHDGVKMADDDQWTITSQDASRGFKEVTAAGSSWLLTNETEFIVVSGHGLSDLKVTPYTGMSGLVGTGSSAVITKVAEPETPAEGEEADPLTGDMNNVYFKVKDYRYGTVGTANNRTIEKVILSEGNLMQYGVQSMYFAAPGAEKTNLQLAGEGKYEAVDQYKLYKDGVLGYYWIEHDENKGIEATGGEKGTFYHLIPVDEVSGQTIYKAEALDADPMISYNGNVNTGVTYEYFVVNDYGTARLSKGAIGEGDEAVAVTLAFNMKGANVTDTSDNDIADEIKDVTGLNHAVSVGYTVEVAVVYSNSDVSQIYVTSITAGAAEDGGAGGGEGGEGGG